MNSGDVNDDNPGFSEVVVTQVDAAALIQAEVMSHAYGTTDNIITVPDAVIANLAKADTSITAADDWTTEWSFILGESIGPAEDAPTAAEGTGVGGDHAVTLSDTLLFQAIAADPVIDALAEETPAAADYAMTTLDAVPIEPAIALEPVVDGLTMPVQEASTSLWSSAFLS